MRAKLGARKAITATAHKIARIIYHRATTRHAYDETNCVQNELPNRQHLEARVRKQAWALGFQLVAASYDHREFLKSQEEGAGLVKQVRAEGRTRMRGCLATTED